MLVLTLGDIRLTPQDVPVGGKEKVLDDERVQGTPCNTRIRSATARVSETHLGRLGKHFVHFFLVGEKLLDARALLHALEMRLGDFGE